MKKKNGEVTGILVRAVGLYPEDDDYISSMQELLTIKTGDTERLVLLKKMHNLHDSPKPF